MASPRITVLISGRGSNLSALLAAMDEGDLGGTVTHVVSNRSDAAGLSVAVDHGIATSVVDHRGFRERPDFDAALGDTIDAQRPDLVVLAGFMRVLGPAFIARYRGRMLNIHPSLLPAYPGLNTHARAIADGARIHGCTVHFVTPEVDVGPIVAQAAVPVREHDDAASLAARVLVAEHVLLPRVVRWYCQGRIVVDGHRVSVRSDAPAAEGVLFSPAA